MSIAELSLLLKSYILGLSRGVNPITLREVHMANEAKDPVCGMNVDSQHAQFKTEHHGKKVAFCSKECMDKFNKNPKQFQK